MFGVWPGLGIKRMLVNLPASPDPAVSSPAAFIVLCGARFLLALLFSVTLVQMHNLC